MSMIETIPRIYLLADHVANQIAAGEVIERPASVIKELIENSFDSSAEKIDIYIEKGGTSLIHVKDDGHGIHPEDMQLALSSHATSKLRELDDLSHVNSLGFRGEALPSIASVSSFTLTSSVNDTGEGLSAKIDTGSQLEIVPAAHPRGTSVNVANLFHQTPARKKFLRTDKTEYLHILETVKRMSLSRFGTELTLYHNGKRVFHSQQCENNKDQRIAYIMGSSFVKKSLVIEYQYSDMHLWGRVGLPSESRSQSNRQYFYLNGRMIRDRQINHAVRMAFDERITEGRYPSYVLYLDMAPAKSDINVHPSKDEVRFSNAREVHDFIYGSIKQCIEKQDALIIDTPAFNELKPLPQAGRPYIGIKEPRLSSGDLKQKSLLNDSVGSPVFYDEYLGQIQQRYLLAKKGEDLLLIDIFSVKKMVFRCHLLTSAPSSPIHCRPLLVPVRYAITDHQAKTIEEYAELFAQFGLQLMLISAQTVMVRTLPPPLDDADIRLLIDSLCRVCADKTDIDENKIIDAMVEQVTVSSVNNMGRDDLHGLFQSLMQCDIDTTSRNHKGLWHCLDANDLSNMLT